MTLIYRKHAPKQALNFCVVSICLFFLYQPGFHGGFFLDDASNLSPLSAITKFNFEQIGLFTMTGISSPLGRPISLLTFALQYQDWPNNPAAFKYVNFFIHLLNTLLVYFLSTQIIKTKLKTNNARIAITVAVLWAIHPLQVSTVLYCIQRMTELSATFTLAGLVIYMKGRLLLSPTTFKESYLWMFLGLFFGSCLSVLSKETGILIFLYVLSIEKTLFHDNNQAPYIRYWNAIFIYLPIIIAIFYLYTIIDSETSFLHRNFTLRERLITENAVILDYLKKIYIPTINSFSLYYDNFPVYSSLLESYKPLTGFLLISFGLYISILTRKKHSLFSLGILWFIFGHSLESTSLPLELYFEHRNYLPIFGLCLSSTYIIYTLRKFLSSTAITFFYNSFICLFIAYLSFVTYQQTTLWGKHEARLIWALEKPTSVRAQSTAANFFQASGNYKQALEFTRKIIDITPSDPAPYMAWLHYRCVTDEIPHPNIKKIQELAETGTISLANMFILNKIVNDMQEGACPNIKYEEISAILDSYLKNDLLIKKQDIYQIYAILEGNQGHYIKALNLANNSLTIQPSVRVALFQLRWLYLLGDHQAAYDYLNKVKKINQSIPKTSMLYRSSIKDWEDFLLNELANKPTSRLHLN